MSLTSILDAVVDTIKTAIPQLKTCESHPGRFDVTELQRVAKRSPAVLIAVLGVDNLVREHGEAKGVVQFGAFVVTTDHPHLPRDQGALLLVDALALLIPDNMWGLEDAEEKPQRLSAQNLFGAHVDRMGVAMWGISWRQRMTLGRDFDAAALAALAPFETLFARYPVADDAPVAEDLVTLPQDGE